jgi:hypothetical protein
MVADDDRKTESSWFWLDPEKPKGIRFSALTSAVPVHLNRLLSSRYAMHLQTHRLVEGHWLLRFDTVDSPGDTIFQVLFRSRFTPYRPTIEPNPFYFVDQLAVFARINWFSVFPYLFRDIRCFSMDRCDSTIVPNFGFHCIKPVSVSTDYPIVESIT